MDVVRLTVVADESAAEILCGLLRTEGIVCSYRYVETGFDGGYSFEEVLVREHDLERARELFESTGEPVVEECARCERLLREDGSWHLDAEGELHPVLRRLRRARVRGSSFSLTPV